jgi:hypothetical protein
MEFADPITIIDPLLWKTGPSPFGAKAPAEKRLGRRVWSLIILSLFLCILINLMGPATAVLVIPALQWIEMPKVDHRLFQSMNGADPPQASTDSWLWRNLQELSPCTDAELTSYNYTCSQTPLGDSLDAWTTSSIAQNGLAGGLGGYAIESEMSFSPNVTYKAKSDNSYNLLVDNLNNVTTFLNKVFWVPNRQTLTKL